MSKRGMKMTKTMTKNAGSLLAASLLAALRRRVAELKAAADAEPAPAPAPKVKR